MAANSYQFTYQLKAALDASFEKTFGSAAKSMTGFSQAAQSVNARLSQIKGYETAEKGLQNLKQSYLTGEISAQQYLKKSAKLSETASRLGADLGRAGIDVNNLSGETERLRAAQTRLNETNAAYSKASAAYDKNKAAISKTRGELLRTVGTATALGTALYLGPVKAATEFESGMAEVQKVVDWVNKKGTPEQIANYKALSRQISETTEQIPMSAKEIQEIMAAAGQAGERVAWDNTSLVAFTKDAAKMGVAFDVTAAQSGEWMAKWQTAFQMGHAEVVGLADAINYLGNNSPASAAEISGIVTKVGALGEVAGMDVKSVASLGAALVGMGTDSDVAATNIKNILLTLTGAKGTGKPFQESLQKLGLTQKKLAADMQKDANGAIIDVMKRVEKLSADERTGVLGRLFGSLSVADVAKLTQNTQEFVDTLEKVGEPSLYAGSMGAEYEKMADTAANRIQLAQNKIQTAMKETGDALMPVVGEITEKVGAAAKQFAAFAEKNPETIQNLVKLAGGFLALKAGVSGAKLVYEGAVQPILAVNKAVAGFNKWKSAKDTAAAAGGAVANTAVAATGLKGALAALVSPVGLTVAGLAAVGVGVYAYMKHMEKARYETIHFSDKMVASWEAYQDAIKKTDEMTKLADEYKELNGKLADATLPEAEKETVLARIKEIEDALIELSDGKLHKIDFDTGGLDGALERVNTLKKGMLGASKIQYEMDARDARAKLPEVKKLLAENKKTIVDKTYDYKRQSALHDDLYDINNDWKAFNLKEHSKEELSRYQKDIQTRATVAAQKQGYSDLNFMQDKDTTGLILNVMREMRENSRVSGAAVVKLNGELADGTEKARAYKDNVMNAITADLGSTYEQALQNLSGWTTELAAAEKNGQGASQRANDLRASIAELTPKAESATKEIVIMNGELEGVEGVEPFDFSQQEGALKTLGAMIQELVGKDYTVNINVKTTNTVNTVSPVSPVNPMEGINSPFDTSKFSGRALGGIITRPELTWVGEGGDAEAIIPLNDRPRSRALLTETAARMGYSPGGAASFSYAPTIVVNGAADTNDIAAALERERREFERKFPQMYRDMLEQERRTAFT